MSLEVSDLNDGNILNATEQKTSENGAIQFSVVLPSGHRIESEWIPQEQRKKALMLWLDAVKQAVVNDAARMRRQKIEEARAVSLESALPENGPAVVPAGTIGRTVTAVTSAQEPIDYVRGQLQSAEAEVNRLTKELGVLRVALDEATRRHQQWITTHSALTGQEIANVQS